MQHPGYEFGAGMPSTFFTTTTHSRLGGQEGFPFQGSMFAEPFAPDAHLNHLHQMHQAHLHQMHHMQHMHRHMAQQAQMHRLNPVFMPDQFSTEFLAKEALHDAHADAQGAAFWQSFYHTDDVFGLFPDAAGRQFFARAFQRPGFGRPGREGRGDGHDGFFGEPPQKPRHARYERPGRFEEPEEPSSSYRRRHTRPRPRPPPQERDYEAPRPTTAAGTGGPDAALRAQLGRRHGEYRQAWEQLTAVPWPVVSGRREDISARAVGLFFHDAPKDVIKRERIRWHPDKVKQRFAQCALSADDVATITAVFQIINQIWEERYSKAAE
ncbi:uncharacterized protein V1510DRAFT_402941 [Dipodascopsis tothii]|uniref:uncharacterized protein n=1 Tax=Dipodascopsis tothii TaxID=44089 RepID=UPI0034CFE2E5